MIGHWAFLGPGEEGKGFRGYDYKPVEKWIPLLQNGEKLTKHDILCSKGQAHWIVGQCEKGKTRTPFTTMENLQMWSPCIKLFTQRISSVSTVQSQIDVKRWRTESRKEKILGNIESKTVEKAEYKHWRDQFFGENTMDIASFGESNAKTSKVLSLCMFMCLFMHSSCVCMCMTVWVYIYLNVCSSVCLWVCTCACFCVWAIYEQKLHIHRHIHRHTQTHLHTHTHIHIHVHMHTLTHFVSVEVDVDVDVDVDANVNVNVNRRAARNGRNEKLITVTAEPFWIINFQLQLQSCLCWELTLDYSYRRAVSRNLKM